VLAFLAKQPPLKVGLEACGASHYWAREIAALGHEAVLVPPQYVKPYVKRGKTDAADAEAICEAMSRPTMRFVTVKTPDEQAVQMLIGLREQFVRRRTQLSNAIPGVCWRVRLHCCERIIAPAAPSGRYAHRRYTA